MGRRWSLAIGSALRKGAQKEAAYLSKQNQNNHILTSGTRSNTTRSRVQRQAHRFSSNSMIIADRPDLKRA